MAAGHSLPPPAHLFSQDKTKKPIRVKYKTTTAVISQLGMTLNITNPKPITERLYGTTTLGVPK